MKLTKKEAKIIQKLLHDFSTDNAQVSAETYIYNCAEAAKNLPERLKRRLFNMKLKGEPYLPLQGLPMSVPVKKTPLIQKSRSQSDFYYQNLITIISCLLGYFYKFNNKKNSCFVDDIFPIEAHRKEQQGTNSVQLDWHAEDAFHQARADYICLFCLRADPNAKTLLCNGKVLNQSVPLSIRKELAQTKYLMKGDSSFERGHNFSRQSYVLEESNDPELIFDPSFMEATDKKGETALQTLSAYIDKLYESVTLKQGDLLIFDNRRVVHSRTPYSPKYDGSDRWLLRTLIVESTWKLKNNLTDDCLTVE